MRSHFFTNFGVAGGLLLLQTFGAGIYSVDTILKVGRMHVQNSVCSFMFGLCRTMCCLPRAG